MNIDLTITLPSGQAVCLEVDAYPNELEILDLETGNEWNPESLEDWKAVETAVYGIVVDRISEGGKDVTREWKAWWAGNPEPEDRLVEFDLG